MEDRCWQPWRDDPLHVGAEAVSADDDTIDHRPTRGRLLNTGINTYAHPRSLPPLITALEHQPTALSVDCLAWPSVRTKLSGSRATDVAEGPGTTGSGRVRVASGSRANGQGEEALARQVGTGTRRSARALASSAMPGPERFSPRRRLPGRAGGRLGVAARV